MVNFDIFNSLRCDIDPKEAKALIGLQFRHDYETPDMWCSRVRAPFKKFLKDHPRYFSENDYIRMMGNMYRDGKFYAGRRTFYIYCTACDSLVFLHERFVFDSSAKVHLEKCIKKEKSNSLDLFLQSIAEKECEISMHKQEILQAETEIKRFYLEITSQSLSHLEKDKLASLSYDYYLNSSTDKYLDSVREKYKEMSLSKNDYSLRDYNFEKSLIDVDKPRSLTPPPLPRKPVALMQHSASAPELKYFPIYSDYKTQIHTRPLSPKGPRPQSGMV